MFDLDEAFHALENLDSEGRKALRLVVKVLGEISGGERGRTDSIRRRHFWFPPVRPANEPGLDPVPLLREMIQQQRAEIADLQARLDETLDGRESAEIHADRVARQYRELRKLVREESLGRTGHFPCGRGEEAPMSAREARALRERIDEAVKAERSALFDLADERTRAEAAERRCDELRAEIAHLRGFLDF